MIDNLIITLLVNTAVFSILFLIMLLLRKKFTRHFSAYVQYLLWFLLIAKLLIPFGFESNISAMNLFQAPVQKEVIAAAVPKENAPVAASTDIPVESGISENTAQNYPEKYNASRLDTMSKPATLEPVWIPGWQFYAFWLWVTGFLSVCIWFLICSRNMRRRINHAKAAPSLHVLLIFEQCKRQLGVKKRVDIVMQSALPSPAMLGIIKPVLIIPEDLNQADEQTLRIIFLHELAHQKSGDLMVIFLLNALNAVYWFNPLVWVCFTCIRKDMETLCDQRVIKAIGQHNRQSYIRIVLQFAAKPLRAPLQAAMSLNDGKSGMEKRIRGMYKTTHTGIKGKIVVFITAALMLAASVTTACQPTPETPAVVNKAGNKLEKIIESSAQSPAVSSASSSASVSPSAQSDAIKKAVGAPDSFKDSYTNKKGDVIVSIEAKVEVPMVESIPAIAVKPQGFSQEMTDKFAAYFFKGAQLMTNDRTKTKSEIMQMIIEAKNEGKDHTAIEYGDKGKKEYIDDLEKQYEKAPEEKKNIPTTSKLVPDKNGTVLNVTADIGKDGLATLDVSNYKTKEYQGYEISFTNDGKGDYMPYFTLRESEKVVGQPKEMKTTQEEAIKTVTQFLSDVGIEDMQIDSIHIAPFVNHSGSNGNEVIHSDKQCYQFQLVRIVNGIPLHNIEPSTPMDTDDPNALKSKMPEYRAMQEESMDVFVDDTGIVRFSWQNPMELISNLSQNVTLYKFDEIVKKAKANIFNKNYTSYGSKANIKITSIKLNMMRIMRQDKPDEYLIVPVWDFIGNREDIFEGKTEPLGFGDQSYATINAIDGSSINRSWGY